jgi:alginate O-acetyltransferase complex protein AlgI
MSFTEVEFFYFLPLVWAAYWLLPARRGTQNGLLLSASYLFYASWHWKLLALLIGATLVDYAIGRALGASHPPAPGNQRRRRALLAVSLVANFGVLAFFKYHAFFAEAANEVLGELGFSPSLPVLHLLLPLGLSFYTLQRVGYICDVYWERLPACRSLLDFAVFVAFFPQLTAGPISRGAELLPQLGSARRLEARWLMSGAGAFLLGFVLKALAADVLGRALVEPVFAAPGNYSAFSAWLGVIGYAGQVFADFAGYSLMAIGVARLFAIELPVNFNAPYLSRSLPELWRRWHISLNRWLFDYIFTPLTTSRGWFRGRIDAALMLVFLASGLWHGASWTFVIWGVMQGIGMVIHHQWDERYRALCRRDRRFVAWRQSAPYQGAAWVLTIGFFVLTLVPFRAPSADLAWAYLGRLMPGTEGALIDLGLFGLCALLLIVGLHLLEIAPLTRLRERFLALPALVRGAAYGAVIAALILAVPLSRTAFIYQQF